MNNVKENISAISTAVPVEFLKSVKAENMHIASQRTVRFDLPKPGKDGINRIKITHEGGKFLIRAYKIEEVEVLYDLPSENVVAGIKTLIGAE